MRTPVYRAVWKSETEVPAYYPVVWRDLTLAEHQRFRSRSEHLRIVFCDIYETIVLEGPDLAHAPAGIVAWVARQQLEQNPFSGQFRPIHNALQQARQRVDSSWFHAAKAVIASSFRYSFEEIESWPPDLFFERVAQAELLTGVPLEPADPDQPQPDPKAVKGKNVKQMPQQQPGKRPGNVDRRPQLEVAHNTWKGGR